MKLLTYLLFLSVASIASTTYSQQTKFTMNFENFTVEQVFQKVEENSEFIFLYSEKSLDLSRKIIISVKDKTVTDILDLLFEDTQNYYEINDRQISILEKKVEQTPFKNNTPNSKINKQEQKKKISGKVTDSNGEQLPGVTVIVKGTTIGITTDFDGNYTLEIPDDAEILAFSFVGMKTQEIAIEEQTQINVILEEETIGLDEVVAIGYGIQKKSNVTGAISSVKSEDLANRSTSNAATALQGKVSGVQVMNNSGAPGASSTIRIRGFSSNGTSDPLFIVDGLKVPNIDYLDSDNIESIEILKDGASSAIYGAEAGNGVVLVTTRGGAKNEGQIFVNSQNSFSNVAKKLDVLNAEEFINFNLEANPNLAEELNMFYYNDPSAYVNNKLADTDWQDEIFTTGHMQRYSIGFQGGTDKGSLFVSLNYLDQDGMITGSEDSFTRITGQLNGTYKIKDWLDIGVTNSIETAKTRSLGESDILVGSAVSNIFVLDPLTPVEYSDGLIGASTQVKDFIAQGEYPVINPKTGNYYGLAKWAEGSGNPLALIEKNDDYAKRFQVNGTFYANLKPIKGLILTSRLGYRLGSSYVYHYEPPNFVGPSVSTITPNLNVTQVGSQYYQWENFVNYSVELDQNTFVALAGTSYTKSSSDMMYSFTDDLASLRDNYHYLDYSTTTANDNISGNTTEKVQAAYYGRLSWNYANKYNLQFNFRADTYDAAYLDLEHNWGYFPSVSAGWIIINENFMKNVNRDIFSFAKIRASYGKNGSISNLGGYMYAASLNTGDNYYLNDELTLGINPSEYLANPKLRWEESIQFDVGIDLRFFKDRLSLTVDYFNKNTDGLLIESASSLITGTSYIFQNVGIINNHGFEFDLEWKDVIGQDFNYSIKGNIATVSNNVDEYLGEDVRISGTSLSNGNNVSVFEEGYPIWYLRGYKVSDIDDSNGQPIYENMDDNEDITDADKTFIGSGIPDFTYGATISLSYKNFDLMVYGTGSYGNEIMYGLAKGIPSVLLNKAQFIYDQRWTADNPTAPMASAYYNYDKNYLASDAFVFSGSYFKIKQIQLGYNVPKSVLKLIELSDMRLYMSLDDFFTFTSYPGLDPEVRPNSISAMGIDFGGYPVPKTVMFGVNVTF